VACTLFWALLRVLENKAILRKDYSYVGMQLVLFVLYCIPITLITIEIPTWLGYTGIFVGLAGVLLGVLALLQINVKLSPFPTPVATGRLLTTGAYAVARHPIYTAILAATFGYGLFTESLFKLLLCLALLILFYFKAAYEEQLLTLKYPEYEKYKSKTGKFLPFYKKKRITS